MNAETRYENVFRQERSLQEFIPFSNHISKKDIVTKDGDMLRIYKVEGISFETIDADELTIRKDQLNTLLRGIGIPNVAVWVHHVRRRRTDRLYSHYDNHFCRDFDKTYYESFNGYRMLANELYLTIVYRPSPTAVGKMFSKPGMNLNGGCAHSKRRGSQVLA